MPLSTGALDRTAPSGAARVYIVNEGRRCGYPECCIKQFAASTSIMHAMERGVKVTHRPTDGSESVHVPCDRCRVTDEPGVAYHGWDEWSEIVMRESLGIPD